ncbi:nuclear transport factor 2 family protein [Leptospira sp. 2 VSF19]|uniref:Nuclear transport factor 2 family protein n=1 Tax=Leptospira soteropolitanensis TaxID=2950025 RepID=A0AAW5VHD9_9LEPT|nr:nuclear transport factor 2 family protein [Leptospira soteropolitanensis]MCW7491382.1 nuclear transport factor 2 family protein [Leptospira soteropolitanensis]MCW7498967.1 nuclear transport factor 2 family protein [Leptospira soteropolitanensis]MCW7521441.1 nuclear transport factor 2 family protein [Leptospira soteropolitanensis]MCW7525070.1 nuclear transport factor 2 family protein [Leptospira soteropolitanensis]MCW7528938.1 nuclear transport factor 2 family protein [Leptospira soteropolit
MHPNEELIQKFYTAFQNKDGQTMVSLYHPEVEFHDPAFGHLKGKEAGAMWLMLLERSQNLTIRFSNIKADDTKGSANWEADYNFSKTGRTIHNRINANFTFKDGKILTHKDHFSMWKWLGMAMGPVGYFLGWWPALGNKVRKEAVTGLQLYMKRKRM